MVWTEEKPQLQGSIWLWNEILTSRQWLSELLQCENLYI